MEELLLLKGLIPNTPQCISLYTQQSLRGCYFYQDCILQTSIKCTLQDWFTPMVPHRTKAELCRTSKAGLFLAESTAGLNTINTFSSLSPWLAFSQSQLSLVPGQIRQQGLQKEPQRMGMDMLGLVAQPGRATQNLLPHRTQRGPGQGEQEGSSWWDAAGGSPRTAVTPVLAETGKQHPHHNSFLKQS